MLVVKKNPIYTSIEKAIVKLGHYNILWRYAPHKKCSVYNSSLLNLSKMYSTIWKFTLLQQQNIRYGIRSLRPVLPHHPSFRLWFRIFFYLSPPPALSPTFLFRFFQNKRAPSSYTASFLIIWSWYNFMFLIQDFL